MTKLPRSLLLITATALLCAAAIACGGGDSDPTPTPEPASPTPTRTPSPTLPPIPLPGTEYRLVYLEPGENEDLIWRASPTDLSVKTQLGAIAHSPNCYSTASISPDGRFLFYIVQPTGTECQRDLSQADAYVYDIPWGETTKVAQGVDIRFKPLWTADSSLVYYRRYAGFEILSSNVSVLYFAVNRKPLPWEPTPSPVPTPSPTPTPDPAVTPTPVPTPDPNATPVPTVDPRATPTPTPEPGTTIMRESFARANGFIPLGIGPDGRSLLFVQLPGGTGGPTLLGQYTPGTLGAIVEEAAKAAATAAALGTQTPDPAAPPPPPPTPNAKLVVTLTDETPISFSLSGDGTKVAFTTQALVDGEFVERAYWVDVASRIITPMPLDGLDPIQGYEIVWHPDNARVAIGLMPFGVDPGVVALVPYGGGAANALVGGGSGYDEPVLWSPDGAYLAVRHVEVDMNGTVIFGRMDLLAPIGQRATFAEGLNVEVVGWSPPDAPTPTPAPPPA